ncbi:MAG: hypothetical protein QXF58_06700 [Desulfurococcaceae archaeon]
MSIPIKVIVDWDRISICKECADRIAGEIAGQLSKIRRGEQPQINIVSILCDECFNHNVENGAIRIELDPRLVRRK